MKTAEEMAEFCEKNKTGSGMTKNWTIKHFQVVESQLKNGEEVLFAFVGIYNYVSPTNHDNNYAIAITKNRIIAGQKKLFGENVNITLRKNLNDVSKSTGMIMGVLTIDTIKEVFNVATNKLEINAIHEGIERVLFADETETTIMQSSKRDLDTLKEYKELLDLGIITKEEFELKRQEVLGF